MHDTGAPLVQRGWVCAQAPVPQVWVPALVLVHTGGTLPWQVPGAGSWQSESQVSTAGPAALYMEHS